MKQLVLVGYVVVFRSITNSSIFSNINSSVSTNSSILAVLAVTTTLFPEALAVLTAVLAVFHQY